MFIGLFASNRWETWLTWRNAVAFGQSDPILGRDVSFYVFSLPFLQLVRGLGQALVILAALASGALYLLSGSLTSRLPGAPVDDAGSATAPGAARRCVPALAGGRARGSAGRSSSFAVRR